jgi:hypothetical protein
LPGSQGLRVVGLADATRVVGVGTPVPIVWSYYRKVCIAVVYSQTTDNFVALPVKALGCKHLWALKAALDGPSLGRCLDMIANAG